MTQNTEVQSNIEGLELYSDLYPFRLSLRIKNFESEAEYKKFIRNVEALIRRSIEYKLWTSYIKDILQVNCCMITQERMDEVTIDVHHHVPNLYTLVKGLTNECIEKEQEFSTFDIALKAIEIHYANRVGYVVLLKSMHEKFHNGFLAIPMELIRGDYNWFIDHYNGFLDEEDIERINYLLSINVSNCQWSRDEYPGLEEATQ
jgi:hypothetical protein